MTADDSAQSGSKNALRRIDHLVLATPDLDTGIEHVRDLCGVEPVRGGHHPVYATQNALVALGNSCYLEIIGPDRKVLDREEVKVFGIHELREPTLVTWAVRGSDLEELVESARKDMIDLGTVTLGTRHDTGGTELTWHFTDPLAARHGGVLPFFIDWGDTPHPAKSLPSGCELVDLILYHPHADEVASRMRALGLEMPVETADEPRITATIRTPSGDVTL